MTDETPQAARMRWARLRFGIIALLLSAPPEPGELGASLAQLAARSWRHPTTGEAVRFSVKSLERWYYAARDAQEPIRVLERKVPQHAGTHPSVTLAVAEALRTLRTQHPRWSTQLVHDNLAALARVQVRAGAAAGLCHGLPVHEAPRSGQAPQAAPP
jgi:putative transposase